tara:strand:+ start:5443 stop:6588 length:1146 start_codon:yes stop_codon:yes gene_type:complete
MSEHILDNTSYQDLASMSFGFPTEDEVMDKLNNEQFESADGKEEYSTDVNGNWMPLQENGMMDFDSGFEFVDDDFDEFLTKKARARGRRRRELRKQGRAEGKSRKQARKDARRQAVEEIPPAEIFQKIGRAVKVGALALPRGAYLSLIRVNYRGNAWKLEQVLNNPKYKDKLARVKAKWKKLGGQWDKLVKNVNIGKKKKPFFCGKKCKKKLADKNLKKSFVNFVNSHYGYHNFEGRGYDNEYFNVEPATGTAISVGTWVTIGSSVLSSMVGAMGIVATSKGKKREIEMQERIAKQELATLSQSEKDKIALAEKQLQQQADPIRQIQNNPNLTAQQKADAIKQVQEATRVEDEGKLKKYALYGGMFIVGVVVLAMVFKRNK